jgi:hypothetical protein
MSTFKHIKQVSAVGAALAILAFISNSGNAAKPPPGQAGILVITGSPYSGGAIQYQFIVEAYEPGTISVKPKLRFGNDKKTKLDEYTQSVSVGLNTVTGPVIPVPAGFVGTVILQTKISFNGKKFSSQSAVFDITAPPPAPATPTMVTLQDVGFETVVTLDGSAVPVDVLGPNPTYAWTQLAGKPTMLSSSSAVAPTFTTGLLTDFVDMEDKFGDIDGIGLDAEQVTESTYKFQLVVTGNSQSRTGLYTVVCASESPKQPNVPLGLLAYFKAETNSTDWTLVSKPVGSAAVLLNPTSLTPALRPDVEGTYIIQDNVTGQVRTNTGATWTGSDFCAICHGPGNDVGLKDIVTPWAQTGHATFFKEMINGEHGTYYKESCIKCHVVGYNTTPSANNGGFDDVAAALGWKFPTSINSNNWDALPAQLKALANIQCESCHGPGSRHPGPTSVSLNVAVCAQCHQDGHYHVRVAQWENSPHYKGFREVSEEEGDRVSCARCHAPDGYVDVAKRVANGQDIVSASATNNYATGVGELICQGCHDPHHTFDNPDRHQLRFYDEAVIGDPAREGNVVLTNIGASATCMYCHNSRRLPYQLSNASNPNSQYYKSVRSGNLSGPHESPAAEVFNGLGGVEYGVTMGNTFHTYGGSCVGCHMYADAGAGHDWSLTANNRFGAHTFNMYYLDGTNKVENLAACNQCHAGAFAVDQFDFKSAAAKDWDGNGATDGIQTETKGLLSRVETLLNDTGLVSVTNELGETTGYRTNGLSADAVIKDAQLKAAWNWMLIHRDASQGVHNPLYTLRLLQNTWTDLNTNWTGDVNATFTNAFPNAVLR